MFYSQTLLGRRGRFGVLWIEATGVRKQTRRSIVSVNVRKACADILDYVLLRIPPSGSGRRPRFSLYLSAQLMYGTVKVFNKQHDYLLIDASTFKSRFRLEFAGSEDITLQHIPRSDQVTLPDIAAVAGPKEVGFDPFFGLWKDVDEENATFKSEKWLSPLFESHQMLSPSFLEGAFQPEFGSPHTVSSVDEITMKEAPAWKSTLDLQVPGEKDIPPLEVAELVAITEVPGEGMLGFFDSQSPTDATGTHLPEHVLAPAEETPKKPVRKGATRPGIDRKRRIIMEDESVTPHVAEKLLRPVEENGIELLPVETSPAHRRRRRQLFIDTNIQMTKEQLKHNLSTGHTTVQEFVLPVPLPSAPAELFKRPGSKKLVTNATLLRLWERNCIEEISESESNKERPVWSLPELVRKRGSRTLRRLYSVEEEGFSPQDVPPVHPSGYLEIREGREELPPVEIVRETSKSVTPQLSEHSLSRIDTSHERSAEESLGRTRPHRKSRLSGLDDEAGLRVERAISLELGLGMGEVQELEILPEEIEGLPSTPPLPSRSDELESFEKSSPSTRFLRRCEQTLASEEWTTFRELCPTTFQRPQAAACFYALLELCSRRKVFVKQHKPYDEIYISTAKTKLPKD